MSWENTKSKIDSVLSASVGNLIALNILMGSGFLLFDSARNYPLILKAICAIFFLWCVVTELWFVVTSWRVVFRHHNFFAVALAMQQPQVPMLIRPPLALWWGFQLLLALVWGIVITILEKDIPVYANIILVGSISAFAYITFGYFLLVVSVFTKRKDVITKIWGWRTRWAFVHALVIILTRVFISPIVELH